MGRSSKSFSGLLCVNEEQDKGTKRGDRKLSERFSPNSAFINEMMALLLSAPQMASVRASFTKKHSTCFTSTQLPIKTTERAAKI